jgi:hypothetical protein
VLNEEKILLPSRSSEEIRYCRFSSFMIDFTGNDSSEPLRKEVISKKRDLDKPFPLCIQYSFI